MERPHSQYEVLTETRVAGTSRIDPGPPSICKSILISARQNNKSTFGEDAPPSLV